MKMAKSKETISNNPNQITLEYSSNNSGGHWWLKDEDWLALEKAGWDVAWKINSKSSFGQDKNGRYLGALATEANKKFNSPQEGIIEWENITGKDPWEEGCNCCGKPHSFSYIDENGENHYAQIEVRSSFGGWS